MKKKKTADAAMNDYLKINQIHTDGGTQARACVNPNIVLGS